MARIIAISNHKGGTAKTTTAVNLSFALARRGHKVLLMDMDPQASATQTLRVKAAPGRTSAAMLKESRAVVPQSLASIPAAIDLIPSSADLVAVEPLLNGPGDAFRLSKIMATFRGLYDFVVIDTAPAMGAVTLNALVCADDVIIPLEPEYLALHGLSQMFDTIDEVNAARREPLKPCALACRCDLRKSLHRMTLDTMRANGVKVFTTVIRSSIALAEAPAAGMDIFRYAPKSNGAKDYEALTEEYLTRSDFAVCR